MATSPSPGRRERQRLATIAEIKQTARRLLVTGGPPAVSLRAIARVMGMTPAGLYRYFPSLDALVGALASDLFDELTAVIEAARARRPPDDPIERVKTMAHAFRRWALDHPAEFGLMLGPPIPEMTGLWVDREAPSEASARFCAAFIAEFAALARQRPLVTPSDDLLAKELGPRLGPYMAGRTAGLPLPVIYVFLTAWTRLYGLVAVEVFGHMTWAVTDATALFDLELAAFFRQITGDDSPDT